MLWFLASPMPMSPQWKNLLPIGSNTVFAASKAARLPPIMKVNSAFCAAGTPTNSVNIN